MDMPFPPGQQLFTSKQASSQQQQRGLQAFFSRLRWHCHFMQKLEGNPYGYRFHCELFQSLLQGDKAAGQMVEQLISIFRRLDDFDAVVIVRGGGGSIDLNCFNDVRMARAVARFPLPVITGIGHTANRSVTDEVAYADRITPTDAADFFVEHMLTFENKVMAWRAAIKNSEQS